MTRPYDYRMPVGRLNQRHGANPHTEDNYVFWSSLHGDEGVDVNIQPVWKHAGVHTKESGAVIYCLHGRTAASNGYHHIMENGHCRPMHPEELHRDLDHWNASEVDRWRRGPGARSARPRTLAACVEYLTKHGGTGVFELKYPAWANFPWLLDQAVATCKRFNHSPLFKSLANQTGVRKKAANVDAALVRAGAKGGGFAIIFGDHIKGRGARQAAGSKLMAAWPEPLRKRTRVW